jgi:hypothetical protein
VRSCMACTREVGTAEMCCRVYGGRGFTVAKLALKTTQANKHELAVRDYCTLNIKSLLQLL